MFAAQLGAEDSQHLLDYALSMIEAERYTFAAQFEAKESQCLPLPPATPYIGELTDSIPPQFLDDSGSQLLLPKRKHEDAYQERPEDAYQERPELATIPQPAFPYSARNRQSPASQDTQGSSS